MCVFEYLDSSVSGNEMESVVLVEDTFELQVHALYPAYLWPCIFHFLLFGLVRGFCFQI